MYNITSFLKTKLGFLSTLLFLSAFLAGSYLGTGAYAQVSPPDFPFCASRIFSEDGDRAHYDYGVHGIPGIGNLEGSDDVYTLTSDNFLQCYCPVEDGSGIQSNWWDVSELTQEEIGNFVSEGWIFEESGAAWNLKDVPYLIENIEFSCTEPTPTPTDVPTPTPTETPTPTPTPEEEPESRCVALSASPSEGTAPLTVRFNGSGFDEDGEIQRYKFDFGDASGGQPQVWEQDESEAFHRYEQAGTYTAALHVKDSRGNWRNGQEDCRVEIEVSGEPQVLAAKVDTLPETGIPALLTLGLTAASGLGAYLYKRFRLV